MNESFLRVLANRDGQDSKQAEADLYSESAKKLDIEFPFK